MSSLSQIDHARPAGDRTVDEEIQASEQRFLSLFHDAPVACHEIDRNGIILRVNQTECDLLGFTQEEMVGRCIWDFMAVDEREASLESLRKKLTGEQGLARIERKYTRRDGTTIFLDIHPKLVLSHSGAILGLRSFMIDITERKRAEQALEKKAVELGRSNAELEQFAYVASHDLQEPLRKILAFGDRLKTKYANALTDEGGDYLARMLNAAARMQTLIQDLLELSRVATQPRPFGPVDLADIARHVAGDFESRVERMEGRLEIGALPALIADRAQISQLFQNLIGNALKFHRPDQPPVVKVYGEYLPPGDGPPACRIVVEDNGIGFDEKYLDRIFQIFQRLHGRGDYEGSGIGLAICRKIVERHGGSITAVSSPGAGSKFLVTLPQRPPEGDQP